MGKRTFVAVILALACAGALILGARLFLNPLAYFSARCLATAITGVGDYRQCSSFGSANVKEDAGTPTDKAATNSFLVHFGKLAYPDFDRTASVRLGPKPLVFRQSGEAWPLEESRFKLPADLYLKQGGGVKQVFPFGDRLFALVSRLKGDCLFASVVDLGDGGSVFDADCLPDAGQVDFNGIGGGYTWHEDGLLLALGAPENVSLRIRALAQSERSHYGKILFLRPDGKEGKQEFRASIFTSGHRNPQGMVTLASGRVYAVEHGPKGGDEINLIKPFRNYGWPHYSFGDTYSNFRIAAGAPGLPARFTAPVFSFLPSIAVSDVIECPAIVSKRYAPYDCMILASLRAMSLYVVVLNPDSGAVMSVETIHFGRRIREFARDGVASPDSLQFSTDGAGLFEAKFEKNFVETGEN